MSLYSETFYARELSELFSDRNAIAQLLKVEAALAMAQGEVGIIPESAAKIISDCCVVDAIDQISLKNDIVLGGNAAIPLVKQLTKVIKNQDFEASKHVHLGATSQDIIDTATILTIKEYVVWLDKKLNSLQDALLSLTKEHVQTLMMGRTLLQQAKPMTFGVKTAGWLESIARSKNRLSELKDRLFCIQLGGAVGCGNDSITAEVQEAFAKKLDLNQSFPWQSQRDSLVEFASFLGMLSASMGKIAKDISLLMQTEVAEVFEGAAEGKGGSSTMPHKRNPVGCALILSNAIRTPGLVATMLSAMPQEHERSAGLWHAEWETLTQLMNLTSGSLVKSVDLISNLEVDKERMLQNIEITNGLIYAEKVSLHLSKSLGKMQAHESVKKACTIAIQKQKHLKDVVLEMHSQIENIEELFKPENAIGNSVSWVETILKKYS
ncbi:3-carboxy-cis,cis-muconate cycloisomerase [Aurantibacter crassamenti]|uniref:3-carboxy-cis,cis-muconate cycloisomerase n=1 Tax=Aurantibacter crassamenti TaxID=1837375 RepID=UPI00193A4EE5|nr:3-carboxy-cis,cis-muconate cycloisomerase [Aurantibacter crassamenti]MBM1107324.1 3-carboxy-cis,cis-muconate cycloisomerase [Aurantibacter crassamenti]